MVSRVKVRALRVCQGHQLCAEVTGLLLCLGTWQNLPPSWDAVGCQWDTWTQCRDTGNHDSQETQGGN